MSDQYFSSRILAGLSSQYRASPIFVSLMEQLASEADIIKDELEILKNNRYLTPATGIQLDILGILVGIDRAVVDFIDNIYFGFAEDPTAQSFGDLNDPTVGGRFVSVTENPAVSRRLIDQEYRSLLFAKITKNSTNITPDDVLQITRDILTLMFVGGELITVNVIDSNDAQPSPADAAFTIQIGALLSGSDQAFIADLDIIPRPAGVRISYEYTTPPLTLLGNDGLILFTEDNLQLEIQ